MRKQRSLPSRKVSIASYTPAGQAPKKNFGCKLCRYVGIVAGGMDVRRRGISDVSECTDDAQKEGRSDNRYHVVVTVFCKLCGHHIVKVPLSDTGVVVVHGDDHQVCPGL